VILADSSILIEWQRIPSIRTRQVIATEEAAVCGVTVAELLTGARNPVERQKTMALLGAFQRVAIEEPVWELAGDISAVLRVRGTPLNLADVVIAATAIHHSVPLWTRDTHFSRVQTVAPQLILFDESDA
jgi:predicted nucleic acid-binding protein